MTSSTSETQVAPSTQRRHQGFAETDGAEPTCDLSVIIPIMNEEDSVEPVYSELSEVLRNTELDYEIIFIDDGSSDRTLDRLRQATDRDPRTTVIQLRRNFGQTSAMAAGIAQARGRVIVPMDGDLQNDPHDIPALLKKLDGPPEYDIVSGWRRNRQDKWLNRRLPSMAANWLIRKVTGVKLNDFGCTLKAYRYDAIDDKCLYSELHRFLPILAYRGGATITEMVVNHRPRQFGRTKYGLRRTVKVLLDLVTIEFLSYLNKPLYFFGKLAFSSWFLAGAGLGTAVLQKFGYLGQPDGLNLNRNILVNVSAVLIVFGVQCVLFGIMAELLVRIYQVTRNRPTYRIRRIFSHTASDQEKNVRSG